MWQQISGLDHGTLNSCDGNLFYVNKKVVNETWSDILNTEFTYFTYFFFFASNKQKAHRTKQIVS